MPRKAKSGRKAIFVISDKQLTKEELRRKQTFGPIVERLLSFIPEPRRAFAEANGLGAPSVFSDWSVGKQLPSLNHFATVCAATGASADYILDGLEPRRRSQTVGTVSWEATLADHVLADLEKKKVDTKYFLNLIVPQIREIVTECVEYELKRRQRAQEVALIGFEFSPQMEELAAFRRGAPKRSK